MFYAPLKAFSREIFARRAFKTNDSERREKGVFFFSLVAKGNKGFAFTLLPSPPARKGKSTVIARLHFNALGTRPKNVSKGFLLCGQIFAPTNG